MQFWFGRQKQAEAAPRHRQPAPPPPMPAPPEEDPLEAVSALLAGLKAIQNGAKGLAARGGWVFLINDTNDFLSWHLGLKRWSDDEQAAVRNILDERIEQLSGRYYQMFICPEKSIVYRDYLPAGLDAAAPCDDRPALAMARMRPDAVHYLADRFDALKRLGMLFFRGDTHVNWMGAYHLYRETILALQARGAPVGPPLTFSHLQHFVAGMEGDVLIQLPEAAKDAFEVDASLARVGNMLELVISHTLPEARKRARPVLTPEGFIPGGGGRETVIMEQADKSLPKALIFRDSTATLSIELLAQHFSRSVFVWQDGDVIGDLIDREQPDVILHFVAERFLATYPRSTAINHIHK
ncbi:hypothetical protein [Caulobacter sp. DWR1-3-2b1]|uniref:hypothetical protein n=1 Tax=Caulobacter sp. DWR1-3-2b1 TaxID=2804670 RepID=UPI003CF06F39